MGGVADAVTEEGVRQHFGKWGNVTDVYFPGVKGQKRPNYCFVTFDNYRTSQRACDQSDRAIEGWVSIRSCLSCVWFCPVCAKSMPASAVSCEVIASIKVQPFSSSLHNFKLQPTYR